MNRILTAIAIPGVAVNKLTIFAAAIWQIFGCLRAIKVCSSYLSIAIPRRLNLLPSLYDNEF